jgi:hypothetical protein
MLRITSVLERTMAVGQIGSPAIGTTTSAGSSANPGQSTGIARNETPTRAVRMADVNVTLTPAAREQLSRLEGYVATIGTSKQPKAMSKPGISVDMKV